jgi:8-oxo-dGTP pyrophosphatase MutT (NUDIX family)
VNGPRVNPDWLRNLHASAVQPPRQLRQPLWAGASVIGSVEADFLNQISLQPTIYLREQLSKEERSNIVGWCVHGDVTTTLNELARALHDAGLAGAWRDEQLAVDNENGQRVGTVERAAVRPLGITTHAVHLAAQTFDGRHWVQQRAFNKSNDPGLWDTLMGGMVSAFDTLQTALQRETWEEAGLHIADVQGLRYGGRLTTRRPAVDGNGAGYVVEHIDWYGCTLPDGLIPLNQDGEVEQFALMDSRELISAMERGEFTLEAALILAGVMRLQAFS